MLQIFLSLLLLSVTDGIPLAKKNDSSIMSKIMSSKDDQKYLVSTLVNADPAGLNEAIALAEASIESNEAELAGLITASDNADVAYDAAVTAHNNSLIAQTSGENELEEGLAAAQVIYHQGMDTLQSNVDYAEAAKQSALLAKSTANGILAAERGRLESEIATLEEIIRLTINVIASSDTSAHFIQIADEKRCKTGKWLQIYDSDVSVCLNLILGRQDCNHEYFSHATNGDNNCWCQSPTEDCSLTENQEFHHLTRIYKVQKDYFSIQSGTCADVDADDVMDVTECKIAAVSLGLVTEAVQLPLEQSEGDRPYGCRQSRGSPLWINHLVTSSTTASITHQVICKIREWDLLFRQTSGVFQSADNWLHVGSPNDPNYSKLDSLDDSYRGGDGKFEFMIVWPSKSGDNSNIWKQTSNPMTKKSGGVDGYEAISINYDGCFWGGLEYNSRSESLLDGSVGNTQWWYAIGTSVAYHGGIPGWCTNGLEYPTLALQLPTSVVELYAKRY